MTKLEASATARPPRWLRMPSGKPTSTKTSAAMGSANRLCIST